MNLRAIIEAEIRQHGPIPFSRYMEICLYDPRGGYYASGREQFGKAGDFYTASDVHAVYGRLLARQIEEMWRRLGTPEHIEVVELGPGRGLFARDLLDWSAQNFSAFADELRFTLVEESEPSRRRLQERFAAEIQSGSVTVTREVPEIGGPFVIFANEFFDALPVEVLDWRGEVRVDVENGRIVERFVPASEPVLRFADAFAVMPEQGERIEVTFAACDAVKHIARRTTHARGFFVFVDYGYTREEMLAGRHRGTLRSFRRHTLASDLYGSPGEHDITADVNFTAVAETARRCAIEPVALVTQSQFLMGIGEETQFADVFGECRLPQEIAKRGMQLKHLITPEGMGEAFHVLVMSRGVTADGLSGLRFVRNSDRI